LRRIFVAIDTIANGLSKHEKHGSEVPGTLCAEKGNALDAAITGVSLKNKTPFQIWKGVLL
jgi:hypothetical protein